MSIHIPLLQKGALVDTQSGVMMPHHEGTFSQLFTQLQNNLTPNGYAIPMQTAVNIAALPSATTIGYLVYDSTNNQLKININGTFKVVQVV